MLVFLEDSEGHRKHRTLPEIPEAPAGSIFHAGFNLASVHVHKHRGRADFVNPATRELVVRASFRHEKAEVIVEFEVLEAEIRSFEVFKPVLFEHIPASKVRQGLILGIQAARTELAANFSAEDVAEVLNA